MSRAAVHRVVAASGLYWAGAIAQNAGAHERVALPESIGAGRNGRSIIRSISIISDQNLDYEFWFWGNRDGQQPGHPDLESFLGYWKFSTAGGDGVQIAATGRYYYYIDGLGIPFLDEDGYRTPGPAVIPVTLVNRSASSKTAGSWFQAVFGLEPTYGD